MSTKITPQDFPTLETTRPNGHNINYLKINVWGYTETRDILKSILNVCGLALNSELYEKQDNEDIYNLLKIAEKFIPQEEEYNLLEKLHLQTYRNQENTPENGKF